MAQFVQQHEKWDHAEEDIIWTWIQFGESETKRFIATESQKSDDSEKVTEMKKLWNFRENW